MIPRVDQPATQGGSSPLSREWYRFLRELGSGFIDGSTLNLPVRRTISASTDDGNAGDVCFDTSYAYFCIAANTWRRVSLGGAF